MQKRPLQNPIPCHNKSIGEIRLYELYLNIIKTGYSKPIANVKLNNTEILKAILLKSETRHGCLIVYLFITVLEVLTRAKDN